ncbi:hypothetical protein CapIbe_003315 [Capra ibex]
MALPGSRLGLGAGECRPCCHAPTEPAPEEAAALMGPSLAAHPRCRRRLAGPCSTRLLMKKRKVDLLTPPPGAFPRRDPLPGARGEHSADGSAQ